MFQLILLAAIFYILYRWLRQGRPPVKKPTTFAPRDGRVEEMAKDPVCGTWVPVSQAEELKRDGETFYFCSAECREKFQRGNEDR